MSSFQNFLLLTDTQTHTRNKSINVIYTVSIYNLWSNFISSRDGAEKITNKAEMKERKNTTHCLVCVLFLASSYSNEVFRHFSLVSVLFRGFLNQLLNRRQTRYCTGDERFWLETNAFRIGDKHFNAGDEHFSAGDEHFNAGDERIENECSNLSHMHTASYQRLPNRP